MDSALQFVTPSTQASTDPQQAQISLNSNGIRQCVDWTSNAWIESDFDNSLLFSSQHTTLIVMQDFEPTVLQETVIRKSQALLTPVKNSPTNKYVGSSHLIRDFVRPEPLLFRPKTFWRKTRRSALTGPAYSPASHLVRRAAFIAAGLDLDTPSPDLTALSVDTRAGSVATVLIPQADFILVTTSTCHGFCLSASKGLDIPRSRPKYDHAYIAHRDSLPGIVTDVNTASDILTTSFDYWWPYPPWGASTTDSPDLSLTVPPTSISGAIQTMTSTVTESDTSIASMRMRQTEQSSYITTSPFSSNTLPSSSMSIQTLDFPSITSNTSQDQDLSPSSYATSSMTSSLRVIIPVVAVFGMIFGIIIGWLGFNTWRKYQQDSFNIAGPRYDNVSGPSSMSFMQGLCEDVNVARYDHFVNSTTHIDALEIYDETEVKRAPGLAFQNPGLLVNLSTPVLQQTRASLSRLSSMGTSVARTPGCQSNYPVEFCVSINSDEESDMSQQVKFEQCAIMSYQNSRYRTRGRRMLEKLRTASNARILARNLSDSNEVNQPLIRNTLIPKYEADHLEHSTQKSELLDHDPLRHLKSARRNRTINPEKSSEYEARLGWCSVPDLAVPEKANVWTTSPVRGFTAEKPRWPSLDNLDTIASQRSITGARPRQGCLRNANMDLSQDSSCNVSNSLVARISSAALPSSPPHINSPLLEDTFFFTSQASFPYSNYSQPSNIPVLSKHQHEMSEVQHKFRQCNKDHGSPFFLSGNTDQMVNFSSHMKELPVPPPRRATRSYPRKKLRVSRPSIDRSGRCYIKISPQYELDTVGYSNLPDSS